MRFSVKMEGSIGGVAADLAGHNVSGASQVGRACACNVAECCPVKMEGSTGSTGSVAADHALHIVSVESQVGGACSCNMAPCCRTFIVRGMAVPRVCASGQNRPEARRVGGKTIAAYT